MKRDLRKGIMLAALLGAAVAIGVPTAQAAPRGFVGRGLAGPAFRGGAGPFHRPGAFFRPCDGFRPGPWLFGARVLGGLLRPPPPRPPLGYYPYPGPYYRRGPGPAVYPRPLFRGRACWRR